MVLACTEAVARRCSGCELQDFAFESNEQRMRAAAHLMASSLAGAYAMNQCREPMRTSLLTQLHALLKPSLDPGVSPSPQPC